MLPICLALATLLASTPLLGDPVLDPLQTPPLRQEIDTVEIIRHGALGGAKTLTASDSLAFELAEWMRDHIFHSRTTDATIRKRLILAPGDRADSVRLQEAARLLRLERFLADAKIDTVRLLDNRLAMRVESWDRWSTALVLSGNRSGGEFNWQLGLQESNLLGTGQTVGLVYASTALNSGWTAMYANTALLVPGGQLLASYSDQSDGHILVGSFGFPNRSRYQPWAWQVEFSDIIADRRILATPSVRRYFTQLSGAKWSDDALFSIQPKSRTRLVQAAVTKLWGESTRLGLSLLAESELDSAAASRGAFTVDSARLDLTRRDPVFLEWRQPFPHRDDRRLGIGLSLKSLSHIKRNNFNQLKWTEDVPVGWQLVATAEANLLARGDIRDDGLVQAGLSWVGITGNLYQAVTATWKSYLEGFTPQQGTSSARLEWRWLPSMRFQAIGAIANDARYGVPVWRSQLSLGEDNGLPGYNARSLTGRGRFLTTAEVRWTPPLEALTVAPALAVFAGTGRISDQPSLTGQGPWHTGVGIGLRFGLTRSATGQVNHLSVSFPINDPEHHGWLLSFGGKQGF